MSAEKCPFGQCDGSGVYPEHSGIHPNGECVECPVPVQCQCEGQWVRRVDAPSGGREGELREALAEALSALKLWESQGDCDCPAEGHLCGLPRLQRTIEKTEKALSAPSDGERDLVPKNPLRERIIKLFDGPHEDRMNWLRGLANAFSNGEIRDWVQGNHPDPGDFMLGVYEFQDFVSEAENLVCPDCRGTKMLAATPGQPGDGYIKCDCLNAFKAADAANRTEKGD